ncbi:glycerophosphodiester phosphodiesterase [Nocardioides sp.]|uniref:glycerophosphodiester phosphodiesterase n=1 Tax=Nocardioides sp. TaxID=35761 RepID=UPI003517A7EF
MTSRNPSITRALRPLVLLGTAAALTLGAGTTAATAAPTARPATAPAKTAGPGQPAKPAKPVDRDRGRVRPLVFAHRGASGYRPEHTLAAYQLAVDLGADYIEPDLVPTKDGQLVARHENEISGTTDVAQHPEFADRRTTKVVDGVSETGWFTEDFTLAELKTLRAIERLPQVRPANTAYDGRFEVPTLQEVIDLARRESRRLHRTIGIAPETKHPTYFASVGLPLERRLVQVLRRNGLDRANAPVVVQSFEVGNLKQLHRLTRVPLAQLVDAAGAPYDQVVAGTGVTYADLVTPAGLRATARYATWLAANKNLLLPRDAAGAIGAPSAVTRDAHRAGLRVVTWTQRAENQFLPANLRRGTDPNAYGDMAGETRALLDAGVDAVFADQPDIAVAARDAWVAEQRRGRGRVA